MKTQTLQKLDPEDRAFVKRVTKLYQKGVKQYEIAQGEGMTSSNMTNKLAKLGFRIVKRVVPINYEDAA